MEKLANFDFVKITPELVGKVLTVVDKGLTYGVGVREPGKMCVEAAVAYAMGDDHHHDKPRCVHVRLAGFKIALNDGLRIFTVSIPKQLKVRAKILRRIAIAQLGTNSNKYKLDWATMDKAIHLEMKIMYVEFLHAKINRQGKRERALYRSAMQIDALGVDKGDWNDFATGEVFQQVEKHFGTLKLLGGGEAFDGYGFDFTAFVNDWADEMVKLKQFRSVTAAQMNAVERVVQILIDMKTPGSKYLYLTE